MAFEDLWVLFKSLKILDLKELISLMGRRLKALKQMTVKIKSETMWYGL